MPSCHHLNIPTNTNIRFNHTSIHSTRLTIWLFEPSFPLNIQFCFQNYTVGYNPTSSTLPVYNPSALLLDICLIFLQRKEQRLPQLLSSHKNIFTFRVQSVLFEYFRLPSLLSNEQNTNLSSQLATLISKVLTLISVCVPANSF